MQRLLHVGDEAVVVAVAQAADGGVVFAVRSQSEQGARGGLERMRFATGVDDDLREFHATFWRDPLLGRAIRANPCLRPRRRPGRFETLVAAITEQLIDIERAIGIQRRLISTCGRRCPETGLRDAPSAGAIADVSPARLASFGLAETRALTLRRAAREVAAGRIDLAGPHERVWDALRRLPGIGSWTVEYLALYGHGRYDQVPAGDLGFLKLVGRLTTGRPRARADEAGVREFFEPYGRWRGLAGEYLMWAGRQGLLVTAGRSTPGRHVAS
ncbi:MAG: hypothetical protein M3P40_00325 [Actinomycetota bacterium]|nr:hypothetical protein [Actinomycetota bacterium]